VANQHCYIFSRDRDFYQLLSGRVHVLNTSRPAGRRIITPEEVTRRFQVTPGQWLKVLIADTVSTLFTR
jgi:5'-3' exonuclease